MKIAAISDIHGNLFALDAVLADIDRRDVDLIVNLGDILSGPLLPRETADRLMALDLPTIRGQADLTFDGRDRQGPVTVAVAVERPAGPSAAPSRATRLVFLGTGRLVMNYRLAGTTIRDYDADFMLDAVAWLSDHEARIGIGPKIPERISLALTAADVSWAFRLFVLLLPFAALGAGAFIWWRRRA